MLHGAFTPPYCPALPAQRLGSISLCGGARSTCAHPHNMSRGKNMRSPAPASCHVPCELVSAESCVCVLSEEETCACAREIEIKTGRTRIHAHFFISPPNLLKHLDRELPAPCD